MSYEPRGLPLKALQAVQAHGPMFSGELADKIGCDTVDLYQCTQTLVKHGLLVREKQLLASGAVNRYSLGNGVPLPDPCALDPESKPVQIITTIRPEPAPAAAPAPCPPLEPEPEPEAPPSGIDAVLAERGSRYGKFTGHAEITQQIKDAIRQALAKRSKVLAADQTEALEMIAHKIGRIVNGDPDYADSWVDIAGYAKLVADRLEGAAA